MRKSGFGKMHNLKRGLGLMGWMMLYIVRVNEYLVFEDVVIVVAVF